MRPAGIFPRQKAEAKVVAPEAGKEEAIIQMIEFALPVRHRFPPCFYCALV